MKTRILIFLLLSYVLFPAGVILFNYTIDPHHRFNVKLFKPLLKLLAENKDQFLILPSNYNDRALLKEYLPFFPNKNPDLCVIGGSRVANWDPYNGRSSYQESLFLNTGVSQATIKDYVAVWQLLKETGVFPKTLVVGLSVQSMNEYNQNNNWLNLHSYYENFYGNGNEFYDIQELIFEVSDLLSWQTIQASFRKLALTNQSSAQLFRLLGRKDYQPNFASRSHAFVMDYPDAYENPSLSQAHSLSVQISKGERLALQHWNNQSYNSFEELRLLVQDARRYSRVLLVLMPYHPEVLSVIQKDQIAFLHLQEFIQKLNLLAREERVGFFDGMLEQSFLKGADFMDGVHLKDEPLSRFFSEAMLALPKHSKDVIQ